MINTHRCKKVQSRPEHRVSRLATMSQALTHTVAHNSKLIHTTEEEMDSKQQQPQQEWRCTECDNTGIKCKDCCLAEQHELIEKQNNLLAIANHNLDQRNKQVAEMKTSLEELRSIINQCSLTATQDRAYIRKLQILLSTKEQEADNLKLLANKMAAAIVNQFEQKNQQELLESLIQPASVSVNSNPASSKQS